MITVPVKVWPIDEDCYLVRGTDDVEKACEAVAAVLRESDYHQFTDDEIESWFKRHEAVVGWWRCNPCVCGQEHNFDMDRAVGPGRGNFRGVYFS